MEKMAKGPIVFAAVRLEPFNSMAKPMISQFLTQLLAFRQQVQSPAPKLVK